MQVTNLSDLVLYVYPASGTSAQLNVTSFDSNLPPTSAGELEVAAQNAVVAGWRLNDPARLLPVGGTVTAMTNYPPVQLIVGVDRDISRLSFAATAWTSYVVSNVSIDDPKNWYQTIADCVNETYTLWQQLQQQPPPPADQLILQSLKAAGSCVELRNKVKDYLDARGQQEDLTAEAQRAGLHIGESDWVSEYMHEEQVHDQIEIIR